MDGFLELVVCALAAWRMASLVVVEAGPFDVFPRFRAWVAGKPMQEIPEWRGQISDALNCIWCTSVWTALGAWLWWEYIARWPIIVLAVAGLALIVERAARPETRGPHRAAADDHQAPDR